MLFATDRDPAELQICIPHTLSVSRDIAFNIIWNKLWELRTDLKVYSFIWMTYDVIQRTTCGKRPVFRHIDLKTKLFIPASFHRI
jgi:hypothetical protein